jgi:hypothetical protein
MVNRDKWDKWAKWQVLQQDPQIASFLPETRWMTEKNLWELLRKYGAVILKPAASSGGAGIIVVYSAGDSQYLCQYRMTKEKIEGKNLYSRLAKEILNDYAPYIDIGETEEILSQSYLVQYRIPLAEIDHRPFDIRVMVQRKASSPWKVTGKLAKLADVGYAITNVNLGATILPIERVIQLSPLKNLSERAILSLIDEVALQAAKQLEQHYTSIRIVGFDMCIDTSGKLWIIEANFRPDDYIFLDLEDQTMYNTIQAYR